MNAELFAVPAPHPSACTEAALVPEPALYPIERALLRDVEEAELWGEDVLQPPPAHRHFAQFPGALPTGTLSGAGLPEATR